jgi:hypothetical protein
VRQTVFGRSFALSQIASRALASACGNYCSIITDKKCLKVALWMLWEIERPLPHAPCGEGDAKSKRKKGEGWK